MKKLLTIDIVVLYLAQISLILAEFTGFWNISQDVCFGFFIAAVVCYGISFVLGVAIMITSILLITNNSNVNYNTIMISKIALTPYFIMNFLQCTLLVGGLLNPFLAWSVFIVIPLLIGITYTVLLPTTIASTGLSIRYITKKKLELQDILLYQILEYFFVFDVFASIAMVTKTRYKFKNNQ